MYPTEARGSGVGWAAAVGRIGAIAAPYVVGVIYQSYGKVAGYAIVFGILTGVFVFVAMSVLILGVETKGKTLDELTRGNIEQARAIMITMPRIISYRYQGHRDQLGGNIITCRINAGSSDSRVLV